MESATAKDDPGEAALDGPSPVTGNGDGNRGGGDTKKSQKVTDIVDQIQNATNSPAGHSRPGAQPGSRDGSPNRRSRQHSNIPQPRVSRKNSQELSVSRTTSPNRTPTTVPSAAAIQRALSAPRPQLLPVVDGVLEGSKGDAASGSGRTSPAWPISPRLRSPPPGATSSRRKVDNDHISNTSVKRMTSAPEQILPTDQKEGTSDRSPPPSGMRSPTSRGTSSHVGLETVAEASAPSTPSIGPLLNSFTASKVETPPLDHGGNVPGQSVKNPDTDASAQGLEKTEVENKAKINGPSLRPSNTLAKRSLTNLTAPKNKTGVEPLRTMTVETETVSSVPQFLGADRGASSRDGSGSIRTKPSNEAIRPKKDKKKPSRKAPSLQAGTATSKADIFEARVASAVDEADSSDSEETFVYESNPPDAHSRRHHSRTPSAASLASQNDQHGLRHKHGIRSGSLAVTGKKSMKFTNSAYNNADGEQGGDGGRGSTRNGNATPRHHHISRYNRAGHPSILDGDSPFTQASRAASPRASNMTKSPRPHSPRLGNGRLPNNARKSDLYPDDAYEDAVADDERAPLMGSVRVNRNRHGRRAGSGLRRRDGPPTSCLTRYGTCIVITLLLFLVCVGVATFLVAMNRPLMDVSIKHIQNVLASEQELMLDLHVKAVNPNLFPITITDLDVNIFAASPYVGTADDWRKDHGRRPSRGRGRRNRHVTVVTETFPWPSPSWPEGGVDEGTDPIDDPEQGGQKMLLGQVFEFDSPLVFEPSPMRRQASSSVAEIRLAKPGNNTEEGGSARWERVLQHPFDLIVRGVLQYQLPLSSKLRSTKVASQTHVTPETDVGDETTPSDIRIANNGTARRY